MMQESTNRHRENFKIYDTIPNLYANTIKNLYGMDNVLEKYSLPKLTHKWIRNLNRPTTIEKKTFVKYLLPHPQKVILI